MSTYTPIASQTLASTASSVTFSSIPQGYIDLVLVVAGNNSSSTYSPYIQFNGDTTTNYSITNMYGTGSAAAGSQSTSTSTAYFGSLGATQGNAIVQIQNYSNATTYKTALIRINDAGFRVYASVMLWRSTAAITSVTVFNESPGTFASGTTFSIYGIQVGNATQKAQGGNIVTSDGTYVYHTFTSSGSFIPNEALTVDYLVVAGGGGGGGRGSGGGGAGGYRTSIGGSPLSLTAKPYVVTIGGGGAGGSGTNANDSLTMGVTGFNSTFASITSAGGGGGGGTNGQDGLPGGSGGGAGANYSAALAGAGNTPSTSPSQGNNGGTSTSGLASAGGGGGSGAVGGNAGAAGGNGGNGTANSISGTSVTYAGGGGGGTWDNRTAGTGGSGGGGAGGTNNVAGTAGTVNLGGGGGGGGHIGTGGAGSAGGNGGSGVVIIRYAV